MAISRAFPEGQGPDSPPGARGQLSPGPLPKVVLKGLNAAPGPVNRGLRGGRR